MTAVLAGHWPHLIDAIAFAVILALLATGFGWFELARAKVHDTPVEQAELGLYLETPLFAETVAAMGDDATAAAEFARQVDEESA